MSYRIVVTGGGTAGHTEPLVAIIRALLAQDSALDIVWIGGSKSSREALAAKALHVQFKSVAVGKWRRYFDWHNVVDPLKVGVGYFQAWRYLRTIRPDIVVSKAGYVAVPTVLAARALNIPIVVHESDTVLGLANRLSVKYALAVCTGFPLSLYNSIIQKKGYYTGNPVPYKEHLRESAVLKQYRINTEQPVVAVLGGSQGAEAINELVWTKLAALLEVTQVFHNVGDGHVEAAQRIKSNLSPKLQKRYIVAGVFDRSQLAGILRASWCVVSRAGANTIADLSYFKTPAIIIPLPSAASNHQYQNAQFVVDLGAAEMLEQHQLTADTLLEHIKQLLHDEKRRHIMSRAMDRVNPPNAAAHIAQIVYKELKQKSA